MELADVRISEAEIEATLAAMRSNWLTMGPQTAVLESEFAARFGRRFGVAVSSGAAGLHLACLAAGVGPGDEVIVPSLSFVACAHAPHWCGGEAVLCDVDSPRVPLMSAATVEPLIGPATTAVMAVHMFGYPLELGELRALCDERGLTLIEDCCESAGAGGRQHGSAGETAAFSFFAKSEMPVGEGGIVLTDDPEAEARMRLLRSHAMTSVTWDRHRGHSETYDVTDLGYNYRIDEPRAALARAHLASSGERVAGRRRVAAAYREALGGVGGAELPFDAAWSERSTHFSFPVLVADAATRDAARAALAEAGIQSTVYPAIHQLTLYADARGPCPQAGEVADRHLALPISPYMEDEQVELVVAELARALGG